MLTSCAAHSSCCFVISSLDIPRQFLSNGSPGCYHLWLWRSNWSWRRCISAVRSEKSTAPFPLWIEKSSSTLHNSLPPIPQVLQDGGSSWTTWAAFITLILLPSWLEHIVSLKPIRELSLELHRARVETTWQESIWSQDLNSRLMFGQVRSNCYSRQVIQRDLSTIETEILQFMSDVCRRICLTRIIMKFESGVVWLAVLYWLCLMLSTLLANCHRAGIAFKTMTLQLPNHPLPHRRRLLPLSNPLRLHPVLSLQHTN